MSDESIRVGYINDEREHALISVKHPCLTSQYPKPDITQFAIEIERAAALHDALGEFLRQHQGGLETEVGPTQAEVTPAMVEAGLEGLLGFFPDSASYYDGRAVSAIFKAMCAARGLCEGKPEGPLPGEAMAGWAP